MSTVQTLINRSLRLLGVLSSGASPKVSETADVMTALNAMLETWRLEKLMTYSLNDQTLVMQVGVNSYNIGPAGDLNVTRPVKIEPIYTRINNSDFPIEMIDNAEWDSIKNKSIQTDLVQYAYYNPTYPIGKLQVWPTPSAARTLYLSLWNDLSAFVAGSDPVNLPPGYERAITYNLAIEIAPEFGVATSKEIAGLALTSKASIKRMNLPKMEATTVEIGELNRSNRSNRSTNILVGP